MLLFIAILAFLIMVLLSFVLITGFTSEREEVNLRLKALEGMDEGPGTVIEEEMSVPFKDRIVTPFFDKLSRFFSDFFPSTTIAILDKKLLNANGFYGLSATHFMGLSLVVAIVLSVIVGDIMFLTNKPYNKIMAYAFLTFAIGLFLPYLMLEQKITKRKAALQRELPDVLDLLTVSVEAGLGFDGALVKLSEKMKGEMVDEFTRMLQEVRVGVSRKDALRALAERCNVQDVSLFTSALIQADQLGVSIAKVLRIQSADIREKRKQRAEEQGMKAPIKMLFPLVFFIFPALLIVLLGPAFLQIFSIFAHK
ncbi:MAG: type II secretion system F family protein [Acholeplasmataceae bacterium]|nr:type II secretion system F family protein [Acholeplasmataceae bacterium]